MEYHVDGMHGRWLHDENVLRRRTILGRERVEESHATSRYGSHTSDGGDHDTPLDREVRGAPLERSWSWWCWYATTSYSGYAITNGGQNVLAKN